MRSLGPKFRSVIGFWALGRFDIQITLVHPSDRAKEDRNVAGEAGQSKTPRPKTKTKTPTQGPVDSRAVPARCVECRIVRLTALLIDCNQTKETPLVRDLICWPA